MSTENYVVLVLYFIDFCFLNWSISVTVLVSCSPHILEPRIKDGKKEDGDIYFSVAKIEKAGKQICNGVLIDKKWVLTPKSCVGDSSLAEYKVNFTKDDKEEFFDVKIKKAKELEKVNANVILLELEENVQRKVLLLSGVKEADEIINKENNCMAVGFADDGKDLLKTQIKIKSFKKCSRKPCKHVFYFDADKDASICMTDKGSPIICKLGNERFVIGLSNVQRGCKKKTIPGTRLSYISQAIQEIIEDEKNVCSTHGCKRAAEQIIASINTEINPCEDFYEFVCGKWKKKNPLPEDGNHDSRIKEIKENILQFVTSELENPSNDDEIKAVQKAKGFYKACMNKEKIKELGNAPLHKLMEELGGLPMLGAHPGGHWDPDAYSFENLLIKCFQITPALPIISFSFYQMNLDDYDGLGLTLNRPFLLVPDINKRRDNKFFIAYQKTYKELFQAFGANETTAAMYAEEIVDLEIDIEKLKEGIKRDTSEIIKVKDLYKYGHKLDLRKIVEGIYQYGGLSIESSDVVRLDSVKFLDKLHTVLSKHPKRVIASYIISSVVMTEIAFLPKIYTDIDNKIINLYRSFIRSNQLEEDRSQYCLEMLQVRMPDVVGRIFVEEHFLKSERRYILDLIDQQMTAFKKMLDKTKWMSDKTKKRSEEKLDAMKFEAGYRKELQNDVYLNKVHKNFKVDINNPFQTAVSMTRSEMENAVRLLRTKADVDPWRYSTLHVNAEHSKILNTITIYAGMLQPSLYSHDWPEYMNFGGIGATIAHEIAHGFDDTGFQYDKDGKYKLWWPNKDVAKFKKRAQCFVDMMSNMKVPGTGGMTTNGKKTLAETLSDHEGLRVSYLAYRRWLKKTRNNKEEKRLPGLDYTPNQLFFLNGALDFCEIFRRSERKSRVKYSFHPIGSVRINMLHINSKEFAEAWKCPVGSVMNPAKKCSLY